MSGLFELNLSDSLILRCDGNTVVEIVKPHSIFEWLLLSFFVLGLTVAFGSGGDCDLIKNITNLNGQY